MKARNAIATIATAVYCAMVGYWCLRNQEQMRGLKPNEMADFLAGVFGPLGFMWLVFGYLQQGDELEQNTAALRLQAEELRQSVKHQGELAQIAREQLQNEIEGVKEEQRRRADAAKPIFRFTYRGHAPSPPGMVVNLGFLNVGNTATDVRIACSSATVTVAPSRIHRLATGDNWSPQLTAHGRPDMPFTLTITYVDSISLPGSTRFFVSGPPDDPAGWEWEDMGQGD